MDEMRILALLSMHFHEKHLGGDDIMSHDNNIDDPERRKLFEI